MVIILQFVKYILFPEMVGLWNATFVILVLKDYSTFGIFLRFFTLRNSWRNALLQKVPRFVYEKNDTSFKLEGLPNAQDLLRVLYVILTVKDCSIFEIFSTFPPHPGWKISLLPFLILFCL